MIIDKVYLNIELSQFMGSEKCKEQVWSPMSNSSPQYFVNRVQLTLAENQTALHYSTRIQSRGSTCNEIAVLATFAPVSPAFCCLKHN